LSSQIRVADGAEPLWAQLLGYIDEGLVVPIIGPGLVTVQESDGAVTYYAELARRVAERTGVSADDLPPGGELNEVACRFISRGGRTGDLYSQVFMVAREQQPPIAPALLRLAEITPLRLFLTTAFDPMLERALNQVRGAGATQALSYSLTKVQDLKGALDDSDRTIIYHLFGKLAAIPDYALTHEDLLEFIYSLQSETRHPRNLYKELEDRSLLILGSRFSDWLARFFLRAPRTSRLSAGSKLPSFIADPEIARDNNLIVFLNNFSRDTRVFSTLEPAQFVEELHRRWNDLHPGTERSEPKAREEPKRAAEREDPFVFLSYASEDRAIARKIFQALANAKIDAFFDKEGLVGGDNWDPKLIEKIRNCSLFIPIISQNTLVGGARVFRSEWVQAIDLFRQSPAWYSPSDVFVAPVAVDDTREDHARIPPEFRKTQWMRLPQGEPTPEFVERVKQLHRRAQQERAGAL
jgi:hypothetical protein